MITRTRRRVGIAAALFSATALVASGCSGSGAEITTEAAHIVLPRGTAIALVPDSLPDTVAAPAACATATVMAALDAAGDLTDKRVLIFGAGMLGATAAAAAAAAVEAGADVLVVEPNPSRQRQSHRFSASDDDGATTDIAIDFSGVWTAVDAALQRLDVGGG